MTTESADYYMLVVSGRGQDHEVKAGSGLRFSFGVRAWTEMEVRCIKGMYRLKLVSCENNSGFKGS